MRPAVRFVCLSAAIALGLGSSTVASAQQDPADNQPPLASLVEDTEPPDDRPPAGHVSTLDGAARLDRDGEASDVERGLPIVEGDRLRTEAGRVEITLSDGTLLHLDRYTEIEMAAERVVRVSRGRMLVTMKGAGAVSERLSIEAPGALARLGDDGQYRVTVGGDEAAEVELAVLSGSAELSSDGGTVRLGTGERSRVHDGQAPSRAVGLDATESTALERWADELLSTYWQGSAPSQTYLPSELSTYANTFDRYGSWQSDQTYGYVWYPSVASDWRPYYNGRWDHMRRYGWTWIASDPWGYPTHHYGRWQLSMRGTWFWIPSRSWGPAWVYWATTPTYIGWCPLGWNGRPVVSVFTYGSSRHVYARGRDPYRAWTVLPFGSFGRTHVPRYHVDRRILDRDRPTFAMRHLPPGYAPIRRPPSQRADGGWSNYRAYERRMQDRRSGRGDGDRDRGASPARGDYRDRNGSRVTDPGGATQGADNGQPDRAPNSYSMPSRSPYGATYRRAPQSRDDDRDSPNRSGGWSNYREYEQRMRERRRDADENRERSSGRSGSDQSDQSNQSGARSPGYRSPGYRSPDSNGGGYSRPPDSSSRPDAGRPSPGYASPRGDRGGDNGNRGYSPRSSGGGSDANTNRGDASRGDSGRSRGGDSGGGASRGGDGGGSRSSGGGAPRRRP